MRLANGSAPGGAFRAIACNSNHKIDVSCELSTMFLRSDALGTRAEEQSATRLK